MELDTEGVDGGWFGRWVTDEHGLPAFDLAVGRQPTELVLPEGDPRRIWHQVGNDRLTATAHAGGWTTMYVTDHGVTRVSGIDPLRPAELGGMWTLTSADGHMHFDPSESQDLQPRWGVGSARWNVPVFGGRLTRTVWAPFGDVPALRIDVTIRGVRQPAPAIYTERWGVALHHLIPGPLMTRSENAHASQTGCDRATWRALLWVSELSRALTDVVRRAYRTGVRLEPRFIPDLTDRVACRFLELNYIGPGAHRDPAKPSLIDGHPSPLFLAALGPRASLARPAATTDLALEVPLTEATEITLAFAVGWSTKAGLPELLATLRDSTVESAAQHWHSALPKADVPGDAAVAREATWNAYYLRSAQIRDDYFEEHFCPQGSAYLYVQGLQGAGRDHLLTAIPMTFLDPAAARGLLRLVMRLMRPDGRFYYGHFGSGMATGAGLHTEPSDIPLFFLWAVTEHVWATGDTRFLDEDVPFYPKHGGESSKVGHRVVQALNYILGEIGSGPHGLLHVRSGDWNDPISLMVRNRRAFRARGESAYTSAMACFVLPRAADLIQTTEPALANAARSTADGLRNAMASAWTGRWFLRGWDGLGNPIGRDHLFLDSNAWCLIARVGEADQRDRLMREIASRLDDPSPIGATILDRPHRVKLGILPPGWDTNGGVWAAVNGLLTWGYALHDPRRAMRILSKQSLAAHARAYPHIWYGIWSGPDAYNAHWADRPGETFVHPATPMREFPIMNSNAHALPLLALLRVAGIETTPEGILVRPKIPGLGRWHLDMPLLSVSADDGRVQATTRPVCGLGGKARVIVDL